MTIYEIAAAAIENSKSGKIKIWDEQAQAKVLKDWINTEKYLSGHNLAADLSSTIKKAITKRIYDTEVPFVLPYHLWRLEPQLKPVKDFWREKGVKFRTKRMHDGEPCTIYFKIPFPDLKEMEAAAEAEAGTTPDNDYE